MNTDNNDEHCPLLDDDPTSLGNGEHNLLLRGLQNLLPNWFTGIIWFAAFVIVGITGSYCSLEVYHLVTVRNTTSCRKANTISNSILMIYLSVVFVAVVAQLVYLKKNDTWFAETKFRNYPMLKVLIICGCIEITYYSIMLLKYATQLQVLFSVLSTLIEFFFVVALLPFILFCVSYRVHIDHPRIKMTIATIMASCIGGCMMVFVKRVSSKIIKVFNVSCDTVNEHYRFIHDKIDNAAYILRLVDITYILICLVFVVYLLLKQRRVIRHSDQGCDKVPINRDFLSSITLLKYRWPTLTISILLVGAYLCTSFLIYEITGSELPSSSKDDAQIWILSVTMTLYIASIIFVMVYYFTDKRSVSHVYREHLQNDEYFSKFTGVIQMIYGASMIGFYSCIFYRTGVPKVDQLQMTVFLFLIMQVATQLWYIDSAIKKTGVRFNISQCNSLWFPPMAMALFNFGFLIHNIVFTGKNGFIPLGDSTQKIVHSIINDFLSPIVLLNRLHGMTFFINLTLQQWHDT